MVRHRFRRGSLWTHGSEEAEIALDPQNLAEHLEDILGLVSEIIEIEDETVSRIEGLIMSLREPLGLQS